MPISPMSLFRKCSLVSAAMLLMLPLVAQAQERVRARELGVAPGIFTPGENNAITDVPGVRVGQVSL